MTQERMSIRLKVYMPGWGRQVWRRIELPNTDTFAELADYILDAFDFDHDPTHLYAFYLSKFGEIRTFGLGKKADLEIFHPQAVVGFTEDEVNQKYDNHLKEDKHLHPALEEVVGGPGEKEGLR